MAATLTFQYVVTLDADVEHTEEQKEEEILSLGLGQVRGLRSIYDEGITVEGTVNSSVTGETVI